MFISLLLLSINQHTRAITTKFSFHLIHFLSFHFLHILGGLPFSKVGFQGALLYQVPNYQDSIGLLDSKDAIPFYSLQLHISVNACDRKSVVIWSLESMVFAD